MILAKNMSYFLTPTLPSSWRSPHQQLRHFANNLFTHRFAISNLIYLMTETAETGWLK